MHNKGFLFLIIFLTSFLVNAQNNYNIHLKNKKVISTESIYIVFIDNIIEYTPDGKTWVKYFKFNQIDFIEYPNQSILKSFEVKGKNKLLFLRYESSKYKLATISVQVVSNNIGTVRTDHFLYIFDTTNKLVDKIEFKTVNNLERYINERNKVYNFLEKYFSGETIFINELNKYKNNEDSLFSMIINFVSTTNQIK